GEVAAVSFGQAAAGEATGGGVGAAELQADAVGEQRWLDSLTPLATDGFGGLPGSGTRLGLRRTGFFHVERRPSRWWLVDPAGNAFFQLGVCAMTPSDDYTYVAGREGRYAWLPSPRGAFRSAYRT